MNRLTIADIVFIALLSLATGLSFLWVLNSGEEGTTVVITVGGTTVYKGSLGDATLVPIDTPHGHLDVSIAPEGASVLRSSCPNQVCVHTGRRSRAGDVIICVPNNVLIRILGRGPAGVEAVTG